MATPCYSGGRIKLQLHKHSCNTLAAQFATVVRVPPTIENTRDIVDHQEAGLWRRQERRGRGSELISENWETGLQPWGGGGWGIH